MSSSGEPKTPEAPSSPTQRTSSPTTSSSTPRTTKSGLLPLRTAAQQAAAAAAFTTTATIEDDSIESAMHIYEKQYPAAPIKSYCYSLPSRRMAKKTKKASIVESADWMQQQQQPSHQQPQAAKSVASIPQASIKEEEELLVAEVRQKLNALLLYKYQHSKATRELAEVRQALTNLQHGNGETQAATTNKNVPAGFAMASLSAAATGYGGIRSPGIRLVGATGRNRNSTSSGKIQSIYFTFSEPNPWGERLRKVQQHSTSILPGLLFGRNFWHCARGKHPWEKEKESRKAYELHAVCVHCIMSFLPSLQGLNYLQLRPHPPFSPSLFPAQLATKDLMKYGTQRRRKMMAILGVPTFYYKLSLPCSLVVDRLPWAIL
jgi:hypothetical protein